MTEQGKHIKIRLTESQKAEVKAATGKDAETVELSVEELEERIAPGKATVNPKIFGPA
jgi:predicted nucleotidyltransferase